MTVNASLVPSGDHAGAPVKHVSRGSGGPGGHGDGSARIPWPLARPTQIATPPVSVLADTAISPLRPGNVAAAGGARTRTSPTTRSTARARMPPKPCRGPEVPGHPDGHGSRRLVVAGGITGSIL